MKYFLKKTGLSFIYVLFAFSTAQAKNTVLDSLKTALKSATVDTVKINLLTDLGVLFETGANPDFSIALGYYEKAAAIAEKNNSSRQLNKTYSQVLNACFYLGDYPKAMQYTFKQLAFSEKNNDTLKMAASYQLLGFIFSNQENYGKAKIYFGRFMKLAKRKKHLAMMANAHASMAGIYEMEKKYKPAIASMFKALEIYRKMDAQRKDDAVKSYIGSCYFSIASLYKVSNLYKLAMSFSVKSIEIGEKYPTNLYDLSKYYILHGELLTHQGDYAQAEFYLQKGISLALSIAHKEDMKWGYEAISTLYEKKNDYKKAYMFHKRFTGLKDSLLNEKNHKQMAQMNTLYETEKKDKELIKKDAELTKQQAESRQQNIIIGVATCGFILLLIFSIFIFRGYQQKKKAHVAISKQKQIIEERNKEVHDSITYAKRLQQAILATPQEIQKYFPNSFLLYEPKDIVAGDFYFFETTPTHIFIAAADCTGHGVPGAMVSVVCSNALHRAVNEFKLTDPGKILDKTRELVLATFSKSESEVKDGMDISLCSIPFHVSRSTSQNDAGLKPETLKPGTATQLLWAGANNPFWYIENNMMKEIRADKQPIGFVDHPKPFTTHTVSLSPNSTLFLFTDGYADQFGGDKGKKFKYKPMQELLLAGVNLSMQQQKENLQQSFNTWKGNLEQIDDILIFGIRI